MNKSPSILLGGENSFSTALVNEAEKDSSAGAQQGWLTGVDILRSIYEHIFQYWAKRKGSIWHMHKQSGSLVAIYSQAAIQTVPASALTTTAVPYS